MFNALWAVRLGILSKADTATGPLLFAAGDTILVLCTVLLGNATIGFSGWGFVREAGCWWPAASITGSNTR